MNSRLAVAVIIVTWNSSELISIVLSCLRAQTHKPAKIFVVDNFSDDCVQLHKIIEMHPEVELISLPGNIGFAAANNVAIKLCDEIDLVALLNPDAFPEPTWLKNLVDATQKYPDYSFFSSRQMQMNGYLMDGAGDEMSIFGKPHRRGYGKKLHEKYLTDCPVFGACAAAAIYKINALNDINGFDEDYFCYIEDVDLSFRMQLIGHRCMYVAGAVVTHVGSSSLGKRSDFAVFYGQRNMILCFFKNMPIVALVILIPIHIMTNIFFLFASIFVGKFALVFRAKCEAISHLRRLRPKRKIVQQSRKISYKRLFSLFSISFP